MPGPPELYRGRVSQGVLFVSLDEEFLADDGHEDDKSFPALEGSSDTLEDADAYSAAATL